MMMMMMMMMMLDRLFFPPTTTTIIIIIIIIIIMTEARDPVGRSSSARTDRDPDQIVDRDADNRDSDR